MPFFLQLSGHELLSQTIISDELVYQAAAPQLRSVSPFARRLHASTVMHEEELEYSNIYYLLDDKISARVRRICYRDRLPLYVNCTPWKRGISWCLELGYGLERRGQVPGSLVVPLSQISQVTLSPFGLGERALCWEMSIWTWAEDLLTLSSGTECQCERECKQLFNWSLPPSWSHGEWEQG